MWDAPRADGLLPHDGRRSASSTSTPTAPDGIRFWDAIDPDLLRARPSRARARSSRSRRPADAAYKRLTHTIDVPAGGAQLSFWVNRDTEQPTGTSSSSRRTRSGADDWTTLPDAQRPHERRTPASRVPVLARRCTRSSRTTRPPTRDGTCAPTGTTGEWWAATRRERRLRAVDGRPLAPTPATDVEVSLSLRQRRPRPAASGVVVDDVVGLDRRGHDRRSRTTATRSTAGPSPARRRAARRTPTTGSSGTAADAPPPIGEIVDRLARARAGDHRLPEQTCSARTRSRPPAASSTTSTGSASRSRTRRGPSTPATSSSDPESRRRASSSTSSRTSGTATAWRVGRVAAHLAQRGLRHLRRVAVERARGPRHGAGDLRLLLRRDPGRRPVLDSSRSATRARTTCSTARSTTAAR